MRALITLLLCMHLAGPSLAQAARDPLDLPLKQYGLMLGVAVLGGLVSWFAKVRRGELAAWNVMHLVGELATSAFAGLLAYWVCEAAGMQSIYTAPLVGIAGHMGTRGIAMFESWAAQRWGVKPPPEAGA